jgi:hypothetical protein
VADPPRLRGRERCALAGFAVATPFRAERPRPDAARHLSPLPFKITSSGRAGIARAPGGHSLILSNPCLILQRKRAGASEIALARVSYPHSVFQVKLWL